MANTDGESPYQLKNLLDEAAVQDIAGRISGVYDGFSKGAFEKAACTRLPDLELKQRSQHIADCLRAHLPGAFPDAAELLCRAMGPDDGTGGVEGFYAFRFMPCLTFVETYGLEEPAAALDTIERMTLHFSAEFAIRPYIHRYPDLTIPRLGKWARAADWRLRRLASEGSRPRLPWAMRLNQFIEDPNTTIALLDLLHGDPHESVRRSAANHLNDIAKDHPALAVEVAARWWGTGDEGSRWTVRHGMRSLVKQGDLSALRVLGFKGGDKVQVEGLRVEASQVRIGEAVGFSFTLRSNEAETAKLVVDYALERPLASGKRARKVFKIAHCELPPGGTADYAKTQRFKQLSTRTYHPGPHRIEILLNGRPAASVEIDLLP